MVILCRLHTIREVLTEEKEDPPALQGVTGEREDYPAPRGGLEEKEDPPARKEVTEERGDTPAPRGVLGEKEDPPAPQVVTGERGGPLAPLPPYRKMKSELEQFQKLQISTDIKPPSITGSK